MMSRTPSRMGVSVGRFSARIRSEIEIRLRASSTSDRRSGGMVVSFRKDFSGVRGLFSSKSRPDLKESLFLSSLTEWLFDE